MGIVIGEGELRLLWSAGIGGQVGIEITAQ